MLKEAWNSFKDNIKERITNPFLGTFLLVWVVHNWEAVYSFFYFDKDWKLQQKIEYFNKYWIDRNFDVNLVVVAFITLTILIFTYLFLACSRFLANYFENVIIPFIYKISKGKTVTYEIHQASLYKIEELEAKIESERIAKNQAIQERDEFEKRLYETSPPLDIKLAEKPKDFSTLINDVKSRNDKDKFENTMIGILKGYSFDSQNSHIDFLLSRGLIEVSQRTAAGRIYKFTEAGDELRNQYYNS